MHTLHIQGKMFCPHGDEAPPGQMVVMIAVYGHVDWWLCSALVGVVRRESIFFFFAGRYFFGTHTPACEWSPTWHVLRQPRRTYEEGKSKKSKDEIQQPNSVRIRLFGATKVTLGKV